jgi:hypothetical protein
MSEGNNMRISTPLAFLAVAAVSATFLSSTPSWAVDEKSAPNNAPKPRPAATKSGTAPSGRVAANADVLQRRRQAIARMLEASFAFRGPLDDGAPRLVEAKLAGPFSYTQRSLFSPPVVIDSLYCAKSGVKVSIFPPAYRSALIRVQNSPAGERLNAKISLGATGRECYDADYKPFPEMEQLRTQRRRALGKAD